MRYTSVFGAALCLGSLTMFACATEMTPSYADAGSSGGPGLGGQTGGGGILAVGGSGSGTGGTVPLTGGSPGGHGGNDSTGGKGGMPGGTGGDGGAIRDAGAADRPCPAACPAVDCGDGLQPSSDSCGCGICVLPLDGGSSDAIPLKDGAGGTGKDGAAKDVAGSDATVICPAIACPAPPICPNGYQQSPDPCNPCQTCAPAGLDGGSIKDSGSDSIVICPAIACPLIACTTGVAGPVVPCGCPTCAPVRLTQDVSIDR